ncbi:MAG TPA: hypothetical protein VEK38_04555 [Candidatus Bathyarchaeia archaeon]|nr:hypothetical protein [Candidatus Bathyarchaeia archaeon]
MRKLFYTTSITVHLFLLLTPHSGIAMENELNKKSELDNQMLQVMELPVRDEKEGCDKLGQMGDLLISGVSVHMKNKNGETPVDVMQKTATELEKFNIDPSRMWGINYAIKGWKKQQLLAKQNNEG